ncbi:MAG: hypothetical protein MK297_10255 [Planctomycetes bacterium]|nr:hypothetical protein [Planctomycetota bacterium]
MMRAPSAILALCVLSSVSQGQYRGLEYEIAEEQPIIEGVPRAVVRIYAGYDDANSQLNAIFGISTHPLSISTSDPLGFYQHPAGGDTSLAINPASFPFIPDLEFDSWVTLGAQDNEGNQLLNIGIDFGPWNAAGSLDADDGAWFCVPDTPQNFPDASGRVLLMQLTVTYGETISGTIHLQGRDAAGQTTQFHDQTFFIPTGAGGTEYCTGDGTDGLICPCGNPSTSGGCLNGTGSGAYLFGEGSSSIAADNLVLSAVGLDPGQPGLYFQGNNRVAGGAGIHFGDGLRCAGGGVIRLQVRVASDSGESETTASISSLGGVQAGDVRRYQLWYRNPNTTLCGSGFNLSNGYEITWVL